MFPSSSTPAASAASWWSSVSTQNSSVKLGFGPSLGRMGLGQGMGSTPSLSLSGQAAQSALTPPRTKYACVTCTHVACCMDVPVCPGASISVLCLCPGASISVLCLCVLVHPSVCCACVLVHPSVCCACVLQPPVSPCVAPNWGICAVCRHEPPCSAVQTVRWHSLWVDAAAAAGPTLVRVDTVQCTSPCNSLFIEQVQHFKLCGQLLPWILTPYTEWLCTRPVAS